VPHKSSIERTFYVEAFLRCRSFPTAMRALRYVCEYGRACDDTKRVLNVEEYARHVDASLSQAYRRRRAFIQCFPNQSVESVWEIARPLLDDSPFAGASSQAQAVFVGSIKGTWEKP
jgi:hypothetical protein